MTAGQATPRLAILIVDDEPRLLRSYAHFLKRHDLLLAGSVADARAVLDGGFAPDVVLADYDLGDNSTGLDVLTEVTRQAPNARRYLMSAAPELIPASAAETTPAVIDKLAPEMSELLHRLIRGELP